MNRRFLLLSLLHVFRIGVERWRRARNAEWEWEQRECAMFLWCRMRVRATTATTTTQYPYVCSLYGDRVRVCRKRYDRLVCAVTLSVTIFQSNETGRNWETRRTFRAFCICLVPLSLAASVIASSSHIYTENRTNFLFLEVAVIERNMNGFFKNFERMLSSADSE